MVSNDLRKVFCFSSGETRSVLEGIVKDKAEFMTSSESSVMERALIDAFLPNDNKLCSLVNKVYGENLADGFTDAFALLGDIAGHGYDQYKVRTVVECFVENLGVTRPMFKRDTATHALFFNRMERLASSLPAIHSNVKDQILDLISNANTEIPLSAFSIASTIYHNWSIWGTNPTAFYVLSDLSKIVSQQLLDTPSTRLKFVESLKNLTTS